MDEATFGDGLSCCCCFFFKQAKNEQVLLLLPFLTLLTQTVTHGFCLLKAAFHTMLPVLFSVKKLEMSKVFIENVKGELDLFLSDSPTKAANRKVKPCD